MQASSQPELVRSHVECVITPRHSRPPEVLPNHTQVAIEVEVRLLWHRCYDVFQLRNVVLVEYDRELGPIQNISKREIIVVRYENRYTAVVDSIHNSGCVHLVPFDVEAVSASPETLLVRHR